MAPLFKMLHLINELWALSHQVNDLMLVGLPVYYSHELCLRRVCQETGYWLDWEVDCHDVVVFLNFHVTSVVLEKHVRICVLVWAHNLFNIW